MAADFIEQDGNIYLRLTGNTTQVSFNAASESANTYTMSIAGLQAINTGNLTHVFDDDNNTHTETNGSGASFAPFNKNADNTKKVGSFVGNVITSGKYTLTCPTNVSSIGITQEMMNNEHKYYNVTWYAPFQNTEYELTITIEQNMSASGLNSGYSGVAGIIKRTDGFYVSFQRNTPITQAEYNDLGSFGQYCRQYGLTPDSYPTGYVRQFSATATPGAPFSISKNGGVNDPSYVGINQVITAGGSGTRYYQVTGVNKDNTQYTTTTTSHFLCLGNTVLQFQNNTIAYPGIPKNKNLFVKSSGNWKPSRNIFIKDAGTWKQCEKVWIKSGGVWKESYVRNSSDWVNVLEGNDDTLDFAVQVVAQN